MLRIAKRVWAGPCSVVGLLLGGLILLLGGQCRRRSGALEIAPRGDVLAGSHRMPFRAITFGHVIIGASADELARVRAHEQVHVKQYERWGILFFPAYAASSLWQCLNGRRAYWDNHFEVEARTEGSEVRPA